MTQTKKKTVAEARSRLGMVFRIGGQQSVMSTSTKFESDIQK